VCESLANESTRKRETSALRDAMEELGVKSAWIVTRNEEDRLREDSSIIDVVPAWRFLLSVPDQQDFDSPNPVNPS
jgi:predicted AAA+ superfamily ATPase